MNRHAIPMLAAAATLALGQACGSTSSPAAPSHPPTGAHGTVTSPALHVDVRLELQQTTVKAGAQLRGVLIVDNYQSPIKTACGFAYAAGITSPGIPFEPAFTLECRTNQTIPAGVTRYPVVINTTYGSCSQSGQSDGTTPGCLPGPMGAGSRFTIAPPLPIGSYRTAVVINGIPPQDMSLAAPITVTLT